MRISWPEFAFFKVSSASNPGKQGTETVSNSKLEPPAKQSVRLDSLYYLFLAIKNSLLYQSKFTLASCKTTILFTNLVQFPSPFTLQILFWRNCLLNSVSETRAVPLYLFSSNQKYLSSIFIPLKYFSLVSANKKA